MEWFGVLLWLSWSSPWPDYLDAVQAVTPYQAVKQVMGDYQVGHVVQAVVYYDQQVERWYGVTCPECATKRGGGYACE
jgi:hypothetical protein